MAEVHISFTACVASKDAQAVHDGEAEMAFAIALALRKLGVGTLYMILKSLEIEEVI